MKAENIIEAMGLIDDDLIREANQLRKTLSKDTTGDHSPSSKRHFFKMPFRSRLRIVLTAGIALIIAAAALFSRMLLPGRELALSRSSENVTVTYTEHVPPSFSSGSLNYAYSEEEIFSMPDTAVFKGTVTSIQNIEISLNGTKSYRAIASIRIETVYRGPCQEGDLVSVLLPCPISGNLWVEDTDTIAALETGMTGIFMPMIYDENSVLEENGATLFLKDIADYGFYDGVRFAFLETDHGLVFDRSTYQSIAQAQSLDEIEDYILKMLEK